MIMLVHAPGDCVLRIPGPGLPARVAVFAQGRTPGSRGNRFNADRQGGALVSRTPPGLRGIPFVVPE